MRASRLAASAEKTIVTNYFLTVRETGRSPFLTDPDNLPVFLLDPDQEDCHEDDSQRTWEDG